jgi:flagellar hook-length control protein FliK
MNIHQLLSVSQNSPQMHNQGASGRQDSSNGFFKQALLHASGPQSLSSRMPSEASALDTPSPQAQFDALGSLLSDALALDIENVSAALENLGLDISENDLTKLLAQLESPRSDISMDTLAFSEEASAPLDEIAARLALMASFSGDSRQLPTESPIDPTVLETISEQLNIDQTEAAQLVSALSALVGQQQAAQPASADAARLSSSVSTATPTDIKANSTGPQPDYTPTQVSTNGSSPQISSEALMGALLAMEGVPKASQAGEPLLTGFSLGANSGPLASMQQPAQGFAPTVPPTQATLATPFTNPAWSQQLSQQLVQISQRGGEQHVQMQLHPAELGPLSISLKFSEQGAQAHFLSAHAQVRQVLEQAIPQLREALAEQGISLGETSVGEQRDPNAQAFAQSGGQQGSEFGSDGGDIGSDETLTRVAESSPLILNGRVDLYA